jgi:hypothetical protein
MRKREGWRPRRDEVAGAHTDDVWRAVSDASDVIKDMFAEGRERGAFLMEQSVNEWRAQRPYRNSGAGDRRVHETLAGAVAVIDVLGMFKGGFSDREWQVRSRCHQLSASMERVLAQRPPERRWSPPWVEKRSRGRSM